MDEQNVDAPEVIETPESVEETVETPEESLEDRIARLETEKAELEDKNKKLYARVKETKEVKEKPEPVRSPISGLSSADLVAVTNAKVHEDDIEKVERWAKAEGLSIKDALHDPELKAVLELREEQRRMADAANISNVRSGVATVSDDTLLEQARMGKLPDSDYEIERLVAAKARQYQS